MNDDDVTISTRTVDRGPTWMQLTHTPSGISVEGTGTNFPALMEQLRERLRRLVDDAVNDG